jgi:membrane-bound lytic murein transglycosylase A
VIRRLLTIGLLAALAGCTTPPDRLILRPTSFSQLTGWQDDRAAEALAAFRQSCAVIENQSPTADFDRHRIAGRYGDWQTLCREAAAVAPGDDAAARAFFERGFIPVAAANNRREEGLFTGYFEPTLRGSRRRQAPYTVPIHGRPSDLVSVDLGAFRDNLRGQRLAGRVVDGNLRPFADRAAIEDGALAGQGLEILWVDDPVDAFLLHVQGSGRVELDDGARIRIGYAAQNGHPYVAIGRVLADQGVLPLDAVTWPAIRDWLDRNPTEAGKLLRANPSYIFFRELPGDAPLGAQQAPLTPGRSLAVDRTFLPLGIPIWLDATHPRLDGPGDLPLRRLMIAQDTGGAIRGPVRGDVFWGAGPEAAIIAGRMKHPGRYWLLLPRSIAELLPPP